MAIGVIDNFSYNGKKPNFERDSFATLEQMRNIPDTNIDEGHISYCSETGKSYQFKSANTLDPLTGKWRVLNECIQTIIVPELQEDYMIQGNSSDTVEVIYYITVGETVHNITGDSTIKWQNSLPPQAEANRIIVVSVLNNLGVWGVF